MCRLLVQAKEKRGEEIDQIRSVNPGKKVLWRKTGSPSKVTSTQQQEGRGKGGGSGKRRSLPSVVFGVFERRGGKGKK